MKWATHDVVRSGYWVKVVSSMTCYASNSSDVLGHHPKEGLTTCTIGEMLTLNKNASSALLCMWLCIAQVSGNATVTPPLSSEEESRNSFLYFSSYQDFPPCTSLRNLSNIGHSSVNRRNQWWKICPGLECGTALSFIANDLFFLLQFMWSSVKMHQDDAKTPQASASLGKPSLFCR